MLRVFLFGAVLLCALERCARGQPNYKAAHFNYKPAKTRDTDRMTQDAYYVYKYYGNESYRWALDDDATGPMWGGPKNQPLSMSGKLARERYFIFQCEKKNFKYPPCVNLYAPLCGDDGLTYMNDCDLRCFNIRNMRRIVDTTKNVTLKNQIYTYYVKFNTSIASDRFDEPVPAAWRGFLRMVRKVRMGPCILGH